MKSIKLTSSATTITSIFRVDRPFKMMFNFETGLSVYNLMSVYKCYSHNLFVIINLYVYTIYIYVYIYYILCMYMYIDIFYIHYVILKNLL